jgi:omega-6 fatty acid desaturase (delta-12 desaturase)
MRQTELREAIEESPLATLINMVLQQLAGFPSYLIRNAAGQKHYPAGTNHFNPSAIIFKPQHYWQIVASNIGIALNFAILGYWSYKRSFSEMVLVYLIPYLWVNNWLVFITYLQHTDPLLRKFSCTGGGGQS